MTKIYLVKFENEKGLTWGLDAFTNLRKAKAYQRYWNAKFRNRDEWKGDVVKLEELHIMQLDYTKAAIEEEMKRLPY